MNCNANNLTSLDISKNTALKTLRCLNNQIVSIDVSKNTALETLEFDNNQLTSLDVSKNSAADLDGDGVITSNDALIILRIIVGLE